MRKLISLTALLGITLTSAVWAQQEIIPVCPSVTAIQNTPFVNVGLHNGKFAALQFSNYGTGDLWGFGIYDIVAESPTQALAEAEVAVRTLVFSHGPIASPQTNSWGCFYQAGIPVKAIALTAASVDFFKLLIDFQ